MQTKGVVLPPALSGENCLPLSRSTGYDWLAIESSYRRTRFARSSPHVRQRADGYYKIEPPKSEAGERTLSLPPIVANTLREWKLVSPKGELDLAFPNGVGRIENHAKIITRGLIPAQIAAGVVTAAGTAKYTGLHSLRHFFASWCINRKADGGRELPLKVVQTQLGARLNPDEGGYPWALISERRRQRRAGGSGEVSYWLMRFGVCDDVAPKFYPAASGV